MIAGGDRFTPAQNEALLTELDILKEFEKMLTDGLMRAAENKAAVGKVDGKKTIRNAYSLMEFEDENDMSK